VAILQMYKSLIMAFWNFLHFKNKNIDDLAQKLSLFIINASPCHYIGKISAGQKVTFEMPFDENFV